MGSAIVDVAEQKRLNDAREAQIPWKKWGPYLSERQWGKSAKITAKTGMPGITSRTIRLARVPTSGAKMGSVDCATTSSGCALLWRYGTD